MQPFKTILCPTDWSQPSHLALHTARRLARHNNGTLLLLHVAQPLQPALGIVSQQEMQEAAREEAMQQLQQIIAQLPDGEVRAEARVYFGDPADEISRAAAQESADAIVISTHGRSGWSQLIFGSVAQEVVRESPCPVIAIGPHCVAPETSPEAKSPFQRILCPTDWSEAARHAMTCAGEVAERYGAELVLLHVVSPTAPRSADMAVHAEELHQNPHQQATARFAALRESHPELIAARTIVGEGQAAEEITRVAQSENADLIVIGTHGERGWWHETFGSVTHKVVQHAPCPVMVVRAPPQTPG